MKYSKERIRLIMTLSILAAVFLSGILLGPELKSFLIQSLSSDLELSAEGSNLRELHQNVNGLKSSIARLSGTCQTKKVRLDKEEEILQLADRIFSSVETGQTFSIGLATYTYQQVASDIKQRREQHEALGREIQEDQRLINRYTEMLAPVLEMITKTETKLQDSRQEKEAIKAELAALLTNEHVSQALGDNFSFRISLRLEKARQAFLDYLEQLQTSQEMDLAFNSLINWDGETRIPDRHWLDPSTSQAKAKELVVKARDLLQAGDQDEAMVLFKEALNFDPENQTALQNIVSALNAKGVLLWKAGALDEAVVCFNKALNIESDNASSLTKKGICFVFAGSYSEAIALFDQALDANPDYHEAKVAKANTLLVRDRGRYINPPGLSNTYYAHTDLSEADTLFDQVLANTQDVGLVEIARQGKQFVQSGKLSGGGINPNFVMINDNGTKSVRGWTVYKR